MWIRLRSPFLATVFILGLLFMAVTVRIGLGLVNEWPTYDGMAKGGGVTVAVTMGLIGLAMALLSLKPGWRE